MAQLAPVWLDRTATLEKVKDAMQEAAQAQTDLLVLGKAFFQATLFGWP